MEDGTGIVHIAPAFGEDDSRVGMKYKLPYVNPVGEDGKYLVGPWKDMLVFDADIEVIKYLKSMISYLRKLKLFIITLIVGDVIHHLFIILNHHFI